MAKRDLISAMRTELRSNRDNIKILQAESKAIENALDHLTNGAAGPGGKGRPKAKPRARVEPGLTRTRGRPAEANAEVMHRALVEMPPGEHVLTAVCNTTDINPGSGVATRAANMLEQQGAINSRRVGNKRMISLTERGGRVRFHPGQVEPVDATA